MMPRRFARRLLAISSTTSLLLCLFASLMWVRSIWRGDLIAAVTYHTLILRSEPGLLFLDVSRAIPGDRPDWWYDRCRRDPAPPRTGAAPRSTAAPSAARQIPARL